ncbi:hypothetical protein PENTCL1PPCAC_16408, partial [Pristionchus entomophagus]
CGGSFVLYEPDPLAINYMKDFFSKYNFPDLESEVVCLVRFLENLRDDFASWSQRTRKLQKRLFHVLVVQLVVPMFFVFLPCSVLISLLMLHTGINIYPMLGPCSFTIFPVLDALIVMLG